MVEVEVWTSEGRCGRGAAPTGQTVGIHEVQVLRDGDPQSYGGMSVHRAAAHVRDIIAPALIGMDVDDLERVDRRMIDLDGTDDKSRLGGNAIYSTSIAVLRAAAASANEPVYRRIASRPLTSVPVPGFNMVNGGQLAHSVQPFNEFIALPYGAEGIAEAVEIGVTLFEHLGDVLEKHSGSRPGVAKSYGYVAPSDDPAMVLELMRRAAHDLGYADKVCFALDCASSEMYDRESNTYLLHGERVTSQQLIDYARELTEEFNLLFIEDLLDEDDWAGFSAAVQQLPRTLILGDDLIVTNRQRLERAITTEAVDGFILKPNQVGTITEALETHAVASAAGLFSTPSGRSGGVIDDIVMDLSVGLQVPFQKNGAPRSGERIEKLNFLMRAADDLNATGFANLASAVRF